MMRPIDADELIATIRKNVYPIKYDYKYSSDDSGMTLNGIEQAIAETETITLKRGK